MPDQEPAPRLKPGGPTAAEIADFLGRHPAVPHRHHSHVMAAIQQFVRQELGLPLGAANEWRVMIADQ